MSPLQANERAVCEELARVPGTPFDIALRFVPEPGAERVLALEALFRSVGGIPDQVSDPAVGAAKLSWWQGEVSGAQRDGSQHPVVSALLRSGAFDEFDADNWMRYVQSLAAQLDPAVQSDIESLWQSLAETGGREALWLSGLNAVHADAPAVLELGAAGRLLERLAELARGGDGPLWVPLDLMARHGLTRQELSGQPASDPLCGLAASLADFALQRLNLARDQWRPRLCAHPAHPGARFLAVRSAVERRRLRRFRDDPREELGRTRARHVFTDTLAAWNQARRLASPERRPG